MFKRSVLHPLFLGGLAAVQAATAATPPTRLEYAKVIGVADSVYVSRAKTTYTATDGTTKTRYRDAQFQVLVDPNTGVISSVVLVSESASPSSTPVFQPGLYKNTQNGCKMTMSNPTAASGGRSTFTIATDPTTCGSASYQNFQAQITTGAISGHPNQTMIVNAKCTYESPERAYGIGLNGTRTGLYPNEPMYLVDGINQVTVTGLYNYGNGACQIEAGETFTYCANNVCP